MRVCAAVRRVQDERQGRGMRVIGLSVVRRRIQSLQAKWTERGVDLPIEIAPRDVLRLTAENECHYCGGSFAPRELTMDHLVPLIRGGRTVKSNVVPCCKECNSKKRYMLPLEWEEYMGKLERE